VEVALFFQKEIVRAAAAAGPAAGGSPQPAAAGELVRSMLPVVLLSNDNGQIQLARSHGLPALRLAGAGDLDRALSQQVRCRRPLLVSQLARALQ
jgi:hypothetical protein